MLVKSVTSSTTRIFKVANKLQTVRKILKWLCRSSLLNLFCIYLSPYLLNDDHTWDFRKQSPSGFQKTISSEILDKNHTRDLRKKSHLGFQKIIAPEIFCLDVQIKAPQGRFLVIVFSNSTYYNFNQSQIFCSAVIF